MVEPTDIVPRCPWCSARLPPGTGDTCPSCGATLTSSGETQVPGVTAIDPQAVLRGVRSSTAPRRSRLLSFITGEVEDEFQETGNTQALAPPEDDVRREILRMAVAAELADLTAEAGAMAADDAVESGADRIEPIVVSGAAEAAPVAPAATQDSGAPDVPTAEVAASPAESQMDGPSEPTETTTA